jgi:hypothetical protein
MREGLRLVCHPRDDRVFEADVEAVAAALMPTSLGDNELAAAIGEALRDRYPNVRIRSRDPIADYAAEPATWSVYRDGRPTTEGGSGPEGS